MKKIALVLAVLALVGCSKNDPTVAAAQVANQEAGTVAENLAENESATSQPQENMAAISLDWAGRYEGHLPCADCEEITTVLILNANKSFELSRTYVKGENQTTTIVESGNFQWQGTKPIIQLESEKGVIGYYMIGEGFAERLDDQGQKIESSLDYKLRQTTAF